jgi:hypothetical protein
MGMGQVQGAAIVGVAAALPMLKPNTTFNAFAVGIGDPLLSDIITTSASAPGVLRNLGVLTGGDQLGLVELGALYPAISSGATTTYRARSEFSFDPAQLSQGLFQVGLQDGQFTGAGFDILDFTLLENGNEVLDRKFTHLSDALAFFDDNTLSLGEIAPGSNGLVNLQFGLALTAHNAGDGFAVDFAIAAVPEPAQALLLLSFGLIGLGALRLRPRR